MAFLSNFFKSFRSAQQGNAHKAPHFQVAFLQPHLTTVGMAIQRIVNGALSIFSIHKNKIFKKNQADYILVS